MRRNPRWIVTTLAIASLMLGAVSIGIGWASGDGLEAGRFFDDFRVFRAGGQLIVDGDAAQLYDEDRLGLVAFGSSERALFLNPPVWAWVFVPLAGLNVGIGAAIWLIAGAGALVTALRRLGMPWWWAAAALVSVPGLLTIELGQNAFLSAALVAFASWAILEERPLAVALALAALYYKPHFAIGLALVAVVTSIRLRRAVLAVILVWMAFTLLSVWMVPDVVAQWRGNWAALGEASIQHQSGAVSLLVVGWPNWLQIASSWAIALVGVAGLVGILRRSHDLPVKVAAAGLFGVWVAPHLLLYDWMVLVAPLAVLSTRVSPALATTAGSGLVVTAVVAPELERAQLEVFGGWVGIASAAVIGITVWVASRIDEEAGQGLLRSDAPRTRRPP